MRRTEFHARPGFSRPTIAEALKGELAKWVGKRPLSPAISTRASDGRLVPLVLVRVHDAEGRTRSGMLVELLNEKGEVIDESRTNKGGVALLRFPARGLTDENGNPAHGHGAHGPASPAHVKGSVRLHDGTEAGLVKQVELPATQQLGVAKFAMAQLPELPSGNVMLPAGDDPLARLPIDFTPEVCMALAMPRTGGGLSAVLPSYADPHLPDGGARSLVGHRTPLVRRFAVVREDADGNRWLLQLRQEWILLGYSLGELSGVTALEPGAVLQAADQLVQQTSSAIRNATERATSTLTSQLQDLLQQLGSVDTTIRATLTTGAEGFYIGIPLIVGYGTASVSVSEEVDTRVNTSLLVSRSLHQASTLVNQAIAQSQAVVDGAKRTLMNVTNRLAPLVSKVANALQWKLYENYAVCTFVDSVHPITSYPVNAAPPDFTAEDVRALRPFFEPALLDPSLRRFFDELLEAASAPPIATATIEVLYDFPNPFGLFPGFPFGGTVTATMGGATESRAFTTGRGRRVRIPVEFPAPLASGVTVPATVTFAVPALLSSALRILNVRVWAGRSTDEPPNASVTAPSGSSVTLDVQVGAVSAIGAGNVLVEHINKHKSYYLDVLAAAALRFPHLRKDAAQLAGLPDDVWRLPVVGFLGNEVLVMGSADDVPADVLRDLLDRDPGSGTLVQLLAPGAYGELLEGILQLTDIANNLHPMLKELSTISPFGAFPALDTSDPTAGVGGVLGSVTEATGGGASGGSGAGTTVGGVVGGVVGSLPTGGLP